MRMQSILSLIRNSFAHYFSNLPLSTFIIVIPGLVASLVAFLEPAAGERLLSPFAEIHVVLSVLLFLMGVLMTIALIHATDDPALSLKEAVVRSFRQFFKYLGLLVIFILLGIVAFGFYPASFGVLSVIVFFLFTIPCIWLLVHLCFTFFILLLQNTSIVEALVASFKLVRGNWLNIFIRIFVLGLISILYLYIFQLILWMLGGLVGIDIAFGVITFLQYLLTPFFITYMYLMFRELNG